MEWLRDVTSSLSVLGPHSFRLQEVNLKDLRKAVLCRKDPHLPFWTSSHHLLPICLSHPQLQTDTSYKHMPLKYKRPWSEVPIHKVLTEEIHLWHCRNMNLYFFRSFSLAQVICCPFGGASAQFQSCQHYWLSLRNNNKKNSMVKLPQHPVEKKPEWIFQITFMQTSQLSPRTHYTKSRLTCSQAMWIKC